MRKIPLAAEDQTGDAPPVKFEGPDTLAAIAPNGESVGGNGYASGPSISKASPRKA